MNRRTFSVAAVAGSIALAGCDDGTRPDDSADGDEPSVTDVTINPDPPRPDVDRSGLDSWGLYIASAAAARRYFPDEDGSVPFVTETDFAAGERLLYVQVYARQTCYRLRLDGEVHVEDGRPTVPVATERTAPKNQACGSAMTPVDLMVRLSVDSDGAPEAARVRIDDEGDRETITLDAER